MIMNILLMLVGIGMLSAGGEALIRGSLAAAKRLKVSPLLSGLVIVGFGTSAPEMVVSVNAALENRPDIAIGNVVGSNIGNIFLILGLCAIITPLLVKPQALRRDTLVVVASSVLFIILAGQSALVLFDGFILLACLAGYLVWAYQSERKNAGPSAQLHQAEAEELSDIPKSIFWTVAAVLLGLILLVSGSQVLLIGAVSVATQSGVPEAVIGLTLVAVGTSLPELSISIIATIRRHSDVAIGNILGSNIFNLLGILGLSALLQPLPVNPRIYHFDQWVMLGASILLMMFLFKGRSLNRVEGAVFLIFYCVYLWLSFAEFINV